MKFKNFYFYIGVGILSLALGLYYPSSDNSKKLDILEGSILTIFEEVYEQNTENQPDAFAEKKEIDLSIEKVLLHKSSNSNSYNASIHIVNLGKDLERIQLGLINSADLNTKSIKNDGDRFSLKSGEKYVINEYSFALSPFISGENVEFKLQLNDDFIIDSDSSNNVISINVLDYKETLKGIFISEINEKNQYKFDFLDKDYELGEKNYYLYHTNAKDFDIYAQENAIYKEAKEAKSLYSYYELDISKTLINSFEWKSLEFEGNILPYITLYTDPWDTSRKNLIYILSENKTTGDIKMSNLIYLSNPKKLRKDEFAKAFVEATGIEVSEDSMSHYTDISNNPNKKYINTLFEYGLIDISEDEYGVNKYMTREDAIKIVLDYFDIDILSINTVREPFLDTAQNSSIFPYTRALNAETSSINLSKYFYGDEPCSLDYLNFLINEYSENN